MYSICNIAIEGFICEDAGSNRSRDIDLTF